MNNGLTDDQAEVENTTLNQDFENFKDLINLKLLLTSIHTSSEKKLVALNEVVKIFKDCITNQGTSALLYLINAMEKSRMFKFPRYLGGELLGNKTIFKFERGDLTIEFEVDYIEIDLDDTLELNKQNGDSQKSPTEILASSLRFKLVYPAEPISMDNKLISGENFRAQAIQLLKQGYNIHIEYRNVDTSTQTDSSPEA